MPQKGTYTALQKLQPIKVDWAKSAKAGNEREDLLYNRKLAEEKLAKADRDKIDYDAQEAVVTGIDSLDKGLTLGIQEASTMQHEDFKVAREDSKFADSTDYKIRTKNLNNYSKNVKGMSDGVSALAQSVIAKSHDGTLSTWDDELLQTMNGVYTSESVKFGVNKDGSVKTTIALTDQSLISDDNPRGFVKDADGRVKMKTVTPAEVFKGLGGFSITPDVDIQQQATDIGKELGKSVESSIDGYEITSSQTWENKKEETRKIVRGLLGNPTSLTPLAKRLWADEMGEDSRKLSEGDMIKLEDKMLEKIKPLYDEEVKKTFNYGARETAITRAQKKAEGAISPVYVKDNEGSPEVTQINGVDANIISFGGGKGLEIKSTEANKESYKNIYVDVNGNVYADKISEKKVKGDPPIDPKTGKPDMVAWALQGKGWEATESDKPVKLSETEVTNLVTNPKMRKEDNSGFKDNADFKNYMKAKKEKLPKNQTKKSNSGDSIFEN